MKIKTETLTGPDLNYAVAQALGLKPVVNMTSHGRAWSGLWLTQGEYVRCPDYAADWAEGGPIIERKKMTIEPLFFMEGGWRAYHHNLRYDDMGKYIDGSDNMQDGPTPLIAAMRCFVASKLCDEVEIPDELIR